MPTGLRIVPRARGPWLVISGRRRLAVPAEIGRRLLRGTDDEGLAGLVAALRAAGGPEGDAALPSRPALWLRLPLIPPDRVEAASLRLQTVASWPALLGFALMGSLAYALMLGRDWPGATAPLTGPHIILPAFALFAATALWHELGHAAALAREGLPPGGIGAGVLFVMPVLFADVTAAHLLDRPGRLRVDVAGLCWQLGAGGLLMLTARGIGSEVPSVAAALRLGGLASLAAVLWSALPFIRTDGYWFLCDLLGVPDLDRPISAHRPNSRWLAWGAVVYRLLNTLFLLAIGLLLPWRLVAWLMVWTARVPDRTVGLLLLAPVFLVLVAMLWIGVGKQILHLLRASWVDVKTLVGYHP